MSNYLVELSVTHMALIIGYWLFLRKERQYAKMRFYLIGSTVLALTIPLLKLPKLFLTSAESIGAIPMEAIPLDAMTITPVTDMSSWNYDALIWVYLAICVFFLLKFFSSMLYLIYLARQSSHEKFNDLDIRKVRNIKGSFTFFNWIFLSDEIDKNHYDVILNHEKAHASLGHTYDLMFFELFKVCFWWLPSAWFINREIKKIHEYQADAYALKSCSVEQYSSILIRYTLKSNGLSLVNSFHDGLILKRLTAMKQQTKMVSPWKLGALSVLCLILFVVFACSEEPKNDTGDAASKKEQGIFMIVEKNPEFEGGMGAFYQYMRNEMTYPKQARLAGIEGRVDVQFVVEKNGSLSNIQVIHGIGTACDKEALRVVQNIPSFKPGMQQGKPVRVRMVVPITFKLNKGMTNKDQSTQGIIVVEQVESKNGKLDVKAKYTQGEWSGTVRDPEGELMPGANILVGGTTTGTVSDLDGTFKIKAEESQELYVSFVGYETARVAGK